MMAEHPSAMIEHIAARICFPSRADADVHWQALSECRVKEHYRETVVRVLDLAASYSAEQEASDATR